MNILMESRGLVLSDHDFISNRKIEQSDFGYLYGRWQRLSAQVTDQVTLHIILQIS